MNNREIAAALARAIFEAPSAADSRDQVRRIQFKGGTFGAETDLGGFNEHALAGHIQTTLDDLGISLGSRRGTE